MAKTKKKTRMKVNLDRRLQKLPTTATVTITSEEMAALLSGVGAALKHSEPPPKVAPHLASAIRKLDVAFGLGMEG